MTSFEATLARMKELYTYGRELNEDKTPTNYTIEYKAQAADGNTYGIIRECSKYYIKKARKGKEGLAEAYDYLGGFNNKKNYEYSSYAKALKNFELKMSSINEAVEGDVIISTLDPFKKEDFLVEATDAMRQEIARQKQIMFNAAQIMNESSDFSISRKNDTVMYDGKNPEAETGKRGDEEYTETKANPEYSGSKTAGVDKKAEPFKENTPACADQLKENSDNECGILEGDACPKCGKTPCVCEEGCECDSEGDACPKCGKTPCVCEEGCECDSEGDSCVKDGKPCGTGADPKNIGWGIDGQKKVNESDDDDEYAVDGNEEEDADIERGDEPDLGLDGDDEPESGDEDSELPTDGEEEDDDFGEDDSDIDSDDLDDTELSDLDAELNADDDDEFDLEDEDELSLEDNEEGDEDVDMSFDDEIDLGDEDFEDDEEDGDYSPEDFGDEEDTESLGNDEEEFDDSQDNSLEDLTNHIVQEVRQSLINEDELHVFGKHPGYRKKPMELPSTGEDKNQWGEDWNDESVHSEAPFGEKIGDGTPFEKIVDNVVKNVMSIMNEAINKKKAN